MTELKAQARMKARMKLRMSPRTHTPVESQGTVNSHGRIHHGQGTEQALEETPPERLLVDGSCCFKPKTSDYRPCLCWEPQLGSKDPLKQNKKEENDSDPGSKCQLTVWVQLCHFIQSTPASQ